MDHPLVAYCLFHGFAEVADVPGLWVLGTRWQVPQAFVIKRSSRRALLIWGSLLGPGFVTRNPYARFSALQRSVLRSMYCRRFDGVLLLLLEGCARTAYSAHAFSVQATTGSLLAHEGLGVDMYPNICS
jgi:hypothetical protein